MASLTQKSTKWKNKEENNVFDEETKTDKEAGSNTTDKSKGAKPQSANLKRTFFYKKHPINCYKNPESISKFLFCNNFENIPEFLNHLNLNGYSNENPLTCIPNVYHVSQFIKSKRREMIDSDKCGPSEKEINDYFTKLYTEIDDCGGYVQYSVHLK